jgi:preprotein translocase subunit YajC
MTQHILALAQQAPSSGGSPLAGMLVPMLLIFGVMYLLVIRPQSKKAKQKHQMLANLKNGDEVATTGGVIGRISRIKDDEITLLVSEGVRFRFQRSAVTGLVQIREGESRNSVVERSIAQSQTAIATERAVPAAESPPLSIKTASREEDYGVPVQSTEPTGDGAWREANKLVVVRYGTMPALCVKCGQPSAGEPVQKKFYWHKSWLYLLLLLGLLPYALVLVVQERFDLAVPLCGAHQRRRTKLLWLGRGLALSNVIIPLMLGAQFSRVLHLGKEASNEVMVISAIFGVLCLLTGLFLIAIASILHPVMIDESRAIFTGAGRNFLDKLARRQRS